jgi:hypothetical protein
MAHTYTPQKSFVTGNVNGWLAELHGRIGIAKVMRSRFDALTYDLGGSDALSYQHKMNNY